MSKFSILAGAPEGFDALLVAGRARKALQQMFNILEVHDIPANASQKLVCLRCT